MTIAHIGVHSRRLVARAVENRDGGFSWCEITATQEGGKVEITFFTDSIDDARYLAHAFNALPSKVSAMKKEEENADRLHSEVQ